MPGPGAAGHRWVDTDEALSALAGELAAEPVVGIDTEFHRERTYFPKVALVQLAWSDGIALVDALAVDLAALAPILTGATIVMHAAAQDIEVFDHACGTVPADLFDTQIAAGFAGHSTPSLATLVDAELGVRLTKGDRLADWLRRPLPATQLTYAASDVEHLLPLHAKLTSRLVSSGRLEWVTDECTALVRRVATARVPDEAWWRIKEARQLRGKATGVIQELAAWRERRAVETDQPARFVLPDLAVVSIAQRPPATVAELRDVRGLDSRHLRRGADEEIFAAVQAGLALPRDKFRLPSAGDVERDLRPAVTLVSAWLSQLGRELGIDTSLLGTRADVEAHLRRDPDARLANGWRHAVVGEPIRKLVDGDAALAFDGKGGLILEPRAARP